MSTYPKADYAFIVFTPNNSKGRIQPATASYKLDSEKPCTFGKTIYDLSDTHHEVLGATELAGMIWHDKLLCLERNHFHILTPKPGLNLASALFPTASTHTLQHGEKGVMHETRVGTYVLCFHVMQERARLSAFILFCNAQGSRLLCNNFWQSAAYVHAKELSQMLPALPKDVPAHGLAFANTPLVAPADAEPSKRPRAEK